MPNITSLIEAERAFSAMAGSAGIRQAFLIYLANDGIIFRPHPVNGKQWYDEHPELDGFLIWEPAFAELSASGDFGYTTGPWEYRKNSGDEAIVFGHYVSVWKIQPGNEWKVVADVGIQCPSPVSLEKKVFLNDLQTESQAFEPAATKIKMDELINSENNFISMALRDGLILQRKVRSENSQLSQFCLAMRAISNKISFLVIAYSI